MSDSDSDDNRTYGFKEGYVTRMLSYSAAPPTRPGTTRMATYATRPRTMVRPNTGLKDASFPVSIDFKTAFGSGSEFYPISNVPGWFCDKCREHPTSGRRFACGDPSLDLDLCEKCAIELNPEAVPEAVRKEMTSLTRIFKASQAKIEEKMKEEAAKLEALTAEASTVKATTNTEQ